jgi:hypothetical protein
MTTVNDEVEKLLAQWDAFLAVEARTEPDPVRRNVFWAYARWLIEQAVEAVPPSKQDDVGRALRAELIDMLVPEFNDRKFFLAEGVASDDNRPVAVLVAPKTRRVYVVAKTKGDVDVMVPMRDGLLVSVGTGYFDEDDPASAETDCVRVHTPEGVVQKAGGLGLLLYAGLALQAAMNSRENPTKFRACISSCGPFGRSEDATAWWNNQVARKLASQKWVFTTDAANERYDVCQWIDVPDVLGLGIVISRNPKLKGWDSSWRKPPLAVLLETRVDHIPDESFLRWFVTVLEGAGATQEQVAQYLVDNGHGALIGVESPPKRYVANKRAFARFYGDLVDVD